MTTSRTATLNPGQAKPSRRMSRRYCSRARDAARALANKTQLKITSRGAPGLLVPAYLDRGCRYLTVHRYVPLQHERSTGQFLQDVVRHSFPGCPSPGTALQWPTLKQFAISWYCSSEAPLHVRYHHTTSQRRITSTANGIRQRQPDAQWSVASPGEREPWAIRVFQNPSTATYIHSRYAIPQYLRDRYPALQQPCTGQVYSTATVRGSPALPPPNVQYKLQGALWASEDSAIPGGGSIGHATEPLALRPRSALRQPREPTQH
jgi:hypothetical protein